MPALAKPPLPLADFCKASFGNDLRRRQFTSLELDANWPGRTTFSPLFFAAILKVDTRPGNSGSYNSGTVNSPFPAKPQPHAEVFTSHRLTTGEIALERVDLRRNRIEEAKGSAWSKRAKRFLVSKASVSTGFARVEQVGFTRDFSVLSGAPEFR